MKAEQEQKTCPRCGRPGSGPYARPVTKKKGGGNYMGNYMAHSGEHVGKNHRIQWCYLTAEMMLKLAA